MQSEFPDWLIRVAERVNQLITTPVARILLAADVRAYAEDVERCWNRRTRFDAERAGYAQRIAKRTAMGPLTRKNRKRCRAGWRFDYLSWRDDDGLHHVEAWVPPRLCTIPPEYVLPLPLLDGRILTSIERSAVLTAIRDVVYKGVAPIEPYSDARIPAPDSREWATDVARLMHHYSMRALQLQVPGLKDADRPSIEEMLQMLGDRLKDVGAKMPPLLRLLKLLADRNCWMPSQLPSEITLDTLRAMDNEGWIEVEVAKLGGWFSPQRDSWAGGDLETLAKRGYPIRITTAGRAAIAAWEINQSAFPMQTTILAPAPGIPLSSTNSATPVQPLKPKQSSALKLIHSKPIWKAVELLDKVDEAVFRSLDNLELIEIGAHLYEGVHWFSPQRSKGAIYGGPGSDDWDFVLSPARHKPDEQPLVRISAKGKAVLSHNELEDAPSVRATAARPNDSIHPATLAMAILIEDPAISSTELARRVGVSPGTLYSKGKKWKEIGSLLKARTSRDAPAGRKSRDGDLEAWSDEDQSDGN